jgi:hypothetical protein
VSSAPGGEAGETLVQQLVEHDGIGADRAEPVKSGETLRVRI